MNILITGKNGYIGIKFSEYVKKYKEFLSAGCKADPISLLKIAEVDIEDASTYDFAFKFYNELLNLYAE